MDLLVEDEEDDNFIIIDQWKEWIHKSNDVVMDDDVVNIGCN